VDTLLNGERKMELAETGNFRLFAANRKQKRQTSNWLLQVESENENLFSLVSKKQTLMTINISANVPIYD
jgi:hypothetical protein